MVDGVLEDEARGKGFEGVVKEFTRMQSGRLADWQSKPCQKF